MKPLLARWDDFARRLRRARRIVLFLDFDGTLVPIVARPGSARLDARLRALLSRLSGNDSIRVVVVSGRELSDLVARVGLPGIEYYGNHGAERRDAHGRLSRGRAQRARRTIRSVAQALASRLRDVHGLLLEDKGPALAVHYRLVESRMRRRVVDTVDSVARTLGSTLDVRRGKKMVELRRRGLPDKGDAVRRSLARAPRGTLALYFGDDVTDRDAFRALRRDGVTVQVGPTNDARAAEFMLESPRQVWDALRRLEDAVRSRATDSDGQGRSAESGPAGRSRSVRTRPIHAASPRLRRRGAG